MGVTVRPEKGGKGGEKGGQAPDDRSKNPCPSPFSPLVDRVALYRFKSIVIALGGEGHIPWDPVNDSGNHGTFQLAIDLYQQGYDIHMYDEDNVSANGAGSVYNEVVSAVQGRAVTEVALRVQPWWRVYVRLVGPPYE